MSDIDMAWASRGPPWANAQSPRMLVSSFKHEGLDLRIILHGASTR